MVHPANAAPLSEHWKVEPASFEENANDALVLVPLAGGPDVTVVSGGVVSAGGGGGGAVTVQAWLAGVGSTFPATSIARTWNVWLPTARPE